MIERARIIKGPVSRSEPTHAEAARVVPKALVDARAEAARIVNDAKEKAAAIEKAARDGAAAHAAAVAEEARQKAIAAIAAEVITVRAALDRKMETELDRTVDLARVIAERIVGEALRVEPERIGAIANEALRSARGARRVRIDACADDVPALRALLPDPTIEIVVTPDLGRGSLIVTTDVGRIDARLEPQLAHLATALREALAK